MKAILEFDLPEDNCNHIIAINSMGFCFGLFGYGSKVKKNIKIRKSL